MKSLLTSGAALIGLFAVIFVISNVGKTDAQMLGGVNAPKCTVSSTETATVGHQLTTTLLAENGTRAYTRIQTRSGEGNTISLSFDEGAAAVVGEGLQLGNFASTSENYIEFGRATNFPYTGAVTGITNTSSTTLMITECSY